MVIIECFTRLRTVHGFLSSCSRQKWFQESARKQWPGQQPQSAPTYPWQSLGTSVCIQQCTDYQIYRRTWHWCCPSCSSLQVVQMFHWQRLWRFCQSSLIVRLFHSNQSVKEVKYINLKLLNSTLTPDLNFREIMLSLNHSFTCNVMWSVGKVGTKIIVSGCRIQTNYFNQYFILILGYSKEFLS